jgi:hypothetical protein
MKDEYPIIEDVAKTCRVNILRYFDIYMINYLLSIMY